ncbi:MULTISPECIES: transcription termination factor Rho [unclassified Rhodococcus (in: high G+C Gram-positive bacteria)]|uniref:transcription termination factor Rho n=1 Tax=unclassified Rhodococcus (in: high G+C Gram-positive bacteria) TaxID=192944 RepID=UPI001FFB6A77|nr:MULTISPECIES: transcription termination factor Rho [unclassified Rhodococcus (in: high G+C Gram-positive bacteria)]
MTDTELISAPDKTRRGAGLSGMVLTELRSLAGELGIKSVSGMRKGDLIAAISARQSGSGAQKSDGSRSGASKSGAAEPDADKALSSPGTATAGVSSAPVVDGPARAENAPDRTAAQSGEQAPAEDGTDAPRRTRGRRAAGRRAGAPDQLPLDDSATPADATSQSNAATQSNTAAQPGAAESREANTEQSSVNATANSSDQSESSSNERPRRTRSERGNDSRGERGSESRGDGNDRSRGNRADASDEDGNTRTDNNRGEGSRNENNRNENNRNRSRNQSDGRGEDRNSNSSGNNGGNNGPRDSRDNNNQDDEGDGRGRRGRRFRERRRGRDRGEGGESREREPEIREDDVLQPVAGILDVLDNYAFVRTSGYLAGPNDVYVSMNLVRKNGLRRGDAVTGAVRVAREGEQSGQRQKFNPLVRLDTVNGGDVEAARKRPEFGKLTPLYPNQRLRLETTPNILTTRIIDLVMPIGKGQRALIVSPPKAGKTSVLQAIANAISVNNPECYLMVVLVDERPEEVTDMQRSVKGEVIASTFDRPPGDHTAVAELAIERAKRLVEAGQDVVVLLDSITRLGRAYNNSSPASGRILSGGVDSTALYPPKRFLGAARNIENGGSLTIIATAMVETGSTGDTVIFEEFKGTGNAELKLDRKIAERRVFPAVDVNPSGTRKDELLLNPDEAAVLHKLRRVLSGLDSHQAIDLLVDRLKKSKSNLEFLMQVSKTAPGGIDDN